MNTNAASSLLTEKAVEHPSIISAPTGWELPNERNLSCEPHLTCGQHLTCDQQRPADWQQSGDPQHLGSWPPASNQQQPYRPLVPAKMAVENLSLFYGEFQALKNISLSFPTHEVTALIGPSGCGKSTLLKTLNRMNDLVDGCRVEGHVRLDGEDIFGSVPVNDLRRRVGMVFQQPNPFPMSIYDNIAFGPRTHGIKAKAELDVIVEQSLRDAAIWDEVKDRLKKSALGLSGGQQQRLCIARALAVKPEVLLLDESTSALDPISTAKIEELVSELASKYTVVMVTHNMLQAIRVSTKTAFFLMGEMIEAGDTDTLFTHPKDSRTADYISGRFG